MNLPELLVSNLSNPLPDLQWSKLILICVKNMLHVEYDISLIIQIKKQIGWICHVLCSNHHQAQTTIAYHPCVALRLTANQKRTMIFVSQVVCSYACEPSKLLQVVMCSRTNWPQGFINWKTGKRKGREWTGLCTACYCRGHRQCSASIPSSPQVLVPLTASVSFYFI